MVSIQQIKTWCNGAWSGPESEEIIDELLIDSRKINQPAHALFIAIKSAHRDGHDFIRSAYEKGVRHFLVQQEIGPKKFPQTVFIKVENTLEALQQIVTAYRKQFTIQVIGITGSNGKTVVKEWLYQLLAARFNIVRNPKSYNSQIGVPLSVWLLEREHEVAVFEAGISQPGEMERLEKMIQPTMGIFTNIGEAHTEGFINTKQKINEKLLLFRYTKQLIYCSDYGELNDCIVAAKKEKKIEAELITWSQKKDARLRILNTDKDISSTQISAEYQQKNISITIPFTDNASIENAVHCWCVLLLMNVSENFIKEHFLQLQSVAMRLELKRGTNNCTLINDTYNSDLTSLYIALDALLLQQQHQQHTLILSDMLQMGKPDEVIYKEVAEAIEARNINRFIGIGEALYKNKNFFQENKKLKSKFYKSSADFLKKIHLLEFHDEAILLKGARKFSFEKISSLLEEEVHQTVLSISLSALAHNLNVFRQRLAPGVKAMAMVKAFSYGSGSYEIANVLQYSGVDFLGVAYTEEGIELRKAGITMPVMVMSPDAGSFDRMIAWKLEPEIFNIRSLESFVRVAKALRVKNYPIHIKLDTGMHRLGFMQHELPALMGKLKEYEQVKIASVFSHLAASEDERLDDFTLMQARNFDEMCRMIFSEIKYTPLQHLCNSAGIARHPELHYDMVRLGLGLYGVDSSGLLHDELKQVSTLKTTIAQIKEITKGETIGYNRKGVALHNMLIATICVGYADGYPRALGNGKAHVLIHNKPAKLVGIVCMDMCMVDVTDIAEAREGDEVIVFGPQLSLLQLSQWADTIPYEMMTGISQRVKRVYESE